MTQDPVKVGNGAGWGGEGPARRRDVFAERIEAVADLHQNLGIILPPLAPSVHVAELEALERAHRARNPC